jgi:hypothetical protein
VIIYQTDKARFLNDVFTRNIEDVILAEFVQRTGRSVSRGRGVAWAPAYPRAGRQLLGQVAVSSARCPFCSP